MPLSNIIDIISRQFGFSVTDAEEKATLIDGINTAARKIYLGNDGVGDDLDGSLVENVFNINQSSNQVCLTPDAGWIRGVRYFDSRLRVEINDMYPRYHHGGFSREAWPMKFRELNKSPLARDIENQSTLTFTIPAVDGDIVTITIIGSTTNSSFVREVVTIPVGLKSVETVANWTTVKSIAKTGRSLYDISITDAGSNVMAVWPNYMKQLEHVVFQLSDDEYNPPVLDRASVEVCYKQSFVPMEEDSDEFQCGQQYDETIAWKFIELYQLLKKDNAQAALAAKGLVAESLGEIGQNADENRVKKLNFRKPGVYRAFDRLRNGYPYRSL
jgi:hypothetical protein